MEEGADECGECSGVRVHIDVPVSVGNVWRGGWGRYRECGDCLERGMGHV